MLVKLICTIQYGTLVPFLESRDTGRDTSTFLLTRLALPDMTVVLVCMGGTC